MRNTPVTPLARELLGASSANIKRLRKSRNFTKVALGRRVGVSRQTVANWEKGDEFPDFQNLVTLLETFGVSMAELFGDAYHRKDSAAIPPNDAGSSAIISHLDRIERKIDEQSQPAALTQDQLDVLLARYRARRGDRRSRRAPATRQRNPD